VIGKSGLKPREIPNNLRSIKTKRRGIQWPTR
jgi:hypothetical protein